MDFGSTLSISADGMDAQSTRLQVIAENLANKDTTGSAPGADPYRRKTVTFADQMTEDGVEGVTVSHIGKDMTPFETRYDPSNPAADGTGYVKLPNVNSFVELMDMREAERSYSANLKVMTTTRSMMARTLEMLR